MKRIYKSAIVLCVVVLCCYATPVNSASPPIEGGVLPEISLPAPKDSVGKKYLGLSWWGGSFKIPKIKASVVIIEIFSMYCPYCQAEAPKVNELYNKIENNPSLRGKIKLIGIGGGNSVYEVDTFKNKYSIPFPLFPDMDYKIHKQLGEVRTPYFIGVKINTDGSHRVFFSRLGAFESADKFLSLMIRLSGVR